MVKYSLLFVECAIQWVKFKLFAYRFSDTLFDESEDHTYEMEYEEPKNDGSHVWTHCLVVRKKHIESLN